MNKLVLEKYFCQLLADRIGDDFGRDFNDLDWENLYDFAVGQGMINNFYYHIKINNLYYPSGLLEIMRGNYLYSISQEQKLNIQLRELTEVLTRLQVKHIILKGAYLKSYVYPKAELRPMGDIDILIDKAEYDFLFQELVKYGYSSEIENYKNAESALERHYPRLVRSFSDYPLEFHWQLKKMNDPEDILGLWQRAQHISDLGHFSFVLSNEDNILFACYHMFDIDNGVFALKSLLDIHYIVVTGKVDYIKLLLLGGNKKHWGNKRSLFLGLYFSKLLFDTPVPENIIAEIKPDDFTKSVEKHFLNVIFSSIGEDKVSLLLGKMFQGSFINFIKTKLLPTENELVLIENIKKLEDVSLLLYIKRWIRKTLFYIKYFSTLVSSGQMKKYIKFNIDIIATAKWLKR